MSSIDYSMNEQKKTTTAKKKSLRRELETLDDNNSKRARRDFPKCPICEHRIEPIYWTEHYQYELTRLAELDSEAYTDPLDKNKGKRGAAVVARRQLENKKKKHSSVYEETLERIQKNRNKRSDMLKCIDRPEEFEAVPEQQQQQASDAQVCFICNQTLYGDLDIINLHIDNCLANPPTASSEHTIEDPSPSPASSWEQYEWAGEVRVRATAMMEGGYGGAGFATTNKEEAEEDEDLDVEEDDDDQFGTIQYSERDIVVSTEDEEAYALREMVSGGSVRPVQSQEFEETVVMDDERTHHQQQHLSNGQLVIDSLKSRIHQLEHATRCTPRCLICLEPYKTPLTSIICWHVHCEQCWLQTLGSKKLCPQCQKITRPSDLRRVYL
ncbi:hypothetical protein K501DRAFT_252054 [Backusella circina FSU 941]|nr:hypothetical protein K501DRAFT_252054 [Backusella circina FSU 941]